MRIAVAVALLVLAACAKPRATFAPQVAELRRVAIVPPDVHLLRIVFAGDNDPLVAEADAARGELVAAIAPELAAHGFVVLPARLDEADAPAEELRYRVTVAHGQQATLMDDVFAGRPVRSFGPDLGMLADHAQVDGLLLVTLVGATKSGGRVARDVAVSVLALGGVVYKTSATRLFVALVHGTTGKVVWWSWRRTDERAFGGDELRTLVHDLFDQMPMLPASTPPPVPAAPPEPAAAPALQ